MNSLSPALPGLNQGQLQRLEEFVRHGALQAPDQLLLAAYAHLDDVHMVQTRQSGVDARMAEAICRVLDRVVSEWESFSPAEQSWLRGAIQYFSRTNDERPDFAKGGFQDDLEVVNACLRYAHREDWILRFDDPEPQ